MVNLLVTIFAFLVGLGALIIFHEFGHFWVARRLGVKVLRFSIGFGPSIYKWYGKDGVEYVVALIPLGGYVKMLDEREGDVPESERKFAFNTKPVSSRIAIVLAGPAFNIIFAVFAYWLMFMIGVKGLVPMIGQIDQDSIAGVAGLAPYQEIVKVGEQSTNTWQQVLHALIVHLGNKGNLPVKVKLPDSQNTKTFNLNIYTWEIISDEPNLIGALGIEPFTPLIPAVINDVQAGEPAYIAGILPKDEMLSVDGNEVQNWQQFVNLIQERPQKKTTIELKRNDENVTLVVYPRVKIDADGDEVGYLGVTIKPHKMPDNLIRLQRYSPLTAMGKALDKTWSNVILTFRLIGKMITGKVSVKNLSGPITIAQGAGATLQIGLQYYIGFLALISVSLGVLNLLPIPVLDGGHLMYYVIEIITGKPVSDKVMEFGFKIGMLLLIALMTLAFYNDILRLV